MPDLIASTKQDILHFISSMPGAVAFEGYKDGQPIFTDAGSLHNWKTAQKNPEYDADIENALYRSAQQLGPSAQQEYLRSVNASMPRLRFMQEITQGRLK